MKLKHILKKIVKHLPAVLGTVGGTALAGPLGGITGGALGGASMHGKKNKLKGAMRGAALGSAYVAGAPTLFHTLGGTPGSIASTLTGAGGPSLLNQIGISSAPSMGGGLGFFGNAGQKGVLQGIGGVKGLASKVPGGKYLLPAATSVLGRSTQASSGPRQGAEEEYGLEHDPYGYGSSLINPIQPVPVSHQEPPASPQESKKVAEIVNNPRLSALDKLLQILQVLESEHPGQNSAQLAQNLQREEVPRSSFNTESFKRGGYVHGRTGGQDDKVPIDLEEGDYVTDATTVSLLGDGNSHNGADKIKKQLEDKFLTTGIVRNPARSYRVRAIKAKVSPGEYIIKRRVVDAIGRGNNKNGVKSLDKMRNNLRSHKGVGNFLPPKSKSISQYMGNPRVR